MTRQQNWSAQAHMRILDAKKDAALVKKYNTFARKMPSLIQTAGLVQALVFVESRGEQGERFCRDLASIYHEGWATEDLRKSAQKAHLRDYLALSRDLISVSIWLRRFAQIELGEQVGDDA